MPRGFSV